MPFLLSEICDGHGHEEHEELGVFFVLHGAEYSGASGVGERYCDVVGGEDVEYFQEIDGAETYGEFGAVEGAWCVLARGALVCFVVAFDCHAVGTDAEFLKAVAGVDEYSDAADGCEERAAVDGEGVGVGCGYDAVVVGVASVEQAALEGVGGAAEGCVFGCHDHFDGVVLGEDVFEDGACFHGHYAAALVSAAHPAVDVAHEFACVGGCESNGVGFDVEEDALHHGAIFVGAGGEHGVVEAFDEFFGGALEFDGSVVVFAAFICGIFVAIDGHEMRYAFVVVDFYFECGGVDVESDALVGYFFQEIHQRACVDAEASFSVGLGDGYASGEGVLGVHACDQQFVAGERQQEVVEYGDGVFAVDDLAYGGCCRMECLAGYVEFHIWFVLFVQGGI